MRHIHRVAALSLALVMTAGACSGGAPSSPTVAPSATATAGEPVRIEVSLGDDFLMDPAVMSVALGIPVTFVVTNTGSVDHEFFLGSEESQAEHEKEMAGMGGMSHDEPMGIGLKPGVTKELTVTFDQVGTLVAGCHVNGHYLAGMKATINVSS